MDEIEMGGLALQEEPAGMGEGLPDALSGEGAVPGMGEALPGAGSAPAAEDALPAPAPETAGADAPESTASDGPGGLPAEETARQRLEQQLLERQLAGLGLDAAGLFDLLLGSPLLRQTTALAEEALAARAAKKREEAMRGIAALAPELGRPEQLAAAPEYPEMQRLLRQNKGMSELDAFKLAFFDRLTRQRAEAGRQGAINAARGRQHLAGLGGQPAGADELTDEEIREYRRYNPNWTVAEIRRFHREYLETAGG